MSEADFIKDGKIYRKAYRPPKIEAEPDRTPYQRGVVLAHVLLTLALTYPLVFNITEYLIGPPEDNMQTLWNLWWVKHAILELNTHPYYTDYLFYPQGTSLVFHTLSLFNSLLAIPLQFVFGRITCYNLLILLSFVLAGWGMYLLAYQLTRHPGASFIASLVFAYSPYHFAHAEHHLQIASIQFIPFFVHYLLRLLEQPKLRHALIAGGFLFLAALCSWYYLVFLLIFCFILIVYILVSRRRCYLNRQFIGYFLVMLLFFGILISSFVYPLVQEKLYGGRYVSKNFHMDFSADLAAFLIPPPSHPLASDTLHELYDKISVNPWEASVFLGYSVLLLAGYAVFRLGWGRTGYWVTSGLVFGLLALGPRLHILGQNVFPSTPMPYWLIYQIPLFKMISTLSRFVVMTYLSLAVLVAYALERMFYNLADKKILNKLIPGLIGGLILFEYLALPVKMFSPDRLTRSDFVVKQLDADKEDYAVLELPLTDKWCNHLYMYRQTLHQKKLLFGSVSRLSHQALSFLAKSPMESLARGLELEDDYFIKLKPLLIQKKIKYVVLNQYLYKESKRDELYRLLNNAFEKNAEWRSNITIFSVY